MQCRCSGRGRKRLQRTVELTRPPAPRPRLARNLEALGICAARRAATVCEDPVMAERHRSRASAPAELPLRPGKPDTLQRIEPSLRGRLAENHEAPLGSDNGGTLSRTTKVLRFAMKYRHLGGPTEPGAEPAEHDAGDPAEFVSDLKELGPAFVKIGQSLSTRSDLLPPAYIAALEQLQDDVGPVPFEEIRAQIEADLGTRLSKAFVSFDPQPLATASLAQVHTAVLRDEREVVVKVQRPGIAEAIAADLKILSNLAGAADRWTEQGRRVHFATWLQEVGETLSEELDYCLEAENLQLFAAQLREFERIVVPAPCLDLSSARVLTMERVHGSKVSQAIEFRRMEQPLGELAEEILHAYLEQIFMHGLVHADPHPGNVLLTRDNRIGLIDLGMVVRLNPRMRDALLKLLFAAVEGDGDQVATQCIEIGDRLELFDEQQWRRRCGRLIGRYAGSSAHAEPEGQLMMELTRLSIECGLRPPPEIALLGKTLLNLDAVARLLDPGIDVRGIVRRRMQRILPSRLLSMLSPTAAAEQAYEMAELLRDSPRQLRTLLGTLADNRFNVRVSGLEESRLLENLQKIANRISAGVVTAAMIIGAALVLRIDAGPTLLGYPALALLLFLGALVLGAVLVVSALRSDRTPSKYRVRR
jgi:ubiquinone biosynthesis protein